MNTAAPSGKTRSMRIDGEMTIYRAAELKRGLIGALDDACIIELDLSAVSEIDTTGVQLILLAKIMAEAKGGTLVVPTSSPQVREAVCLLGLADHFGHAMPAPPGAGIARPDTDSAGVAHAA